MKKLLKYLRDYKKECVFGPLFKLLEALFELFVPLALAEIIDVAIPNADNGYTVKMCLLLAGLGLVGFASSLTAQYFAAKAACGFSKKLKQATFSHLQTLSHTELDKIGTSTMITRMTSDMNQLQTGVNMALRLFLRSPFVVFGAMIMAFTIDAKSALVFTVIIPLLTVAVFAIILGCIPLYKKVRTGLDGILGKTRENLSGVRVVRAFCLEEKEKAEFDEKNNTLAGLQKLVGRISALLNPLTYVILNLGIIALIYIGAIRVDQGFITQGAVFALYNYMSQILVELVKMANLIVTLTKAVACGNRVAAVFDIKNTVTDGSISMAGDSEYAVRFENVSLKYASAGDESISNIDFSVKKGETVGIIGATGSGKTSLVNLIPRFYDATSGCVYVDGINVRDYQIDALREKIAIVPQKSVLFKGSIRDNMKWGNPQATDEEIYKALETAQALDVVNSKSDGLDSLVEQNGSNFSGGQKQRLAIARALVGNKEILILDDSSSALDFATDKALRHAISDMKKKYTVFVVSQRASSVMHADRIIVLDDGKAVGIGTHGELLKASGIYREICNT